MISTSQHSVDGTAVKLVSTTQTPKNVFLHCVGNGAIYINGSNAVTTSTGFYMDKQGGPIQMELGPNDEIWSVAASGIQNVTVAVVTL